jgi:thiol-disulfide isomerase/thioredoxin
MLSPEVFRAKFEAGLPYEQYVASGRPDQVEKWQRQHDQVRLNEDQRNLITSFQRQVNVLVTSGLWCGDCSAQVPMLDQIANVSPRIQMRILDRDEHLDLAEQVMICGGLRVPTVLFLNEDFEFVSICGDKSLSRLRAKAAKALASYCALPGASVDLDERAATLQDWVQAFELAHLVVRLSPKLRERHGD